MTESQIEKICGIVFNKNKKIEWFISDINFIDSVSYPKPSKKYIPDFYKKIISDKEIFTKQQFDVEQFSYFPSPSAKRCMPFFDSFASGYIQETWCDIYVKYEKETQDVYFSQSLTPLIMKQRPKVFSGSLFDNNDEYYNFEFVWQQYWYPKLPNGYSALITHPLNRIDLPFYSLSGIIDFDRYISSDGGNLPFFIKKNFEGLIPAGTPMYQIIPIKRDKWFSIKANKTKSFNQEKTPNPRKYFFDGYKKLYWQKKHYG